jgi:hypothetical protein
MTDMATANTGLDGGCSIDRADLIVFLNDLLEAERAGAKVALESAAEASDPVIVALLKNIQKDEAQWCAMLFRQIKLMGGEPSLRIGAFHGKAMAIRDLKERIVFLNRGQGWVVRKLREVTPRVRDEALHADLAHMLSSHVANITLANSAIA